MLYLITGVPGSGKTLHMMSMLKKRKDLQNRPLYLDGIPDVDPQQIPHEPIPEGCSVDNWHEWLPPNAILVGDEAQRHFRPRANGSKVPDHVRELETHRHKGVDIFLLTQHPRLLDINVKSFVENHKHFSKTQLGTRRMWEWQKCGNPDSKSDINDALVKPYRLDKSAYGLYKSAEVHTKIKTNKSAWLYVFGITLIGLVVGGIYTYNYMNETLLNADKKPVAAAQAVSASDAAAGDALAAQADASGRYQPAPQDKLLQAEDFKPVMEGKPWTAPAYKEHNQKLQTMPFPVACVKTTKSCTCYTDQATPIRGLDNGLCVDFAENGIYNPYITGGDQPKPVAAPIATDKG